MTKPTVLIVTHHYLPGWKTGGPVRTISNMVELLGDDFDFKILTVDRDRGELKPYDNIQHGSWNVVGKSQVRYVAPSEYNLRSLRKIIWQTSYDILYLNSVLAGLVIKVQLLNRLRLIPGKPVVIAPRGHLDYNALRVKAGKKRLYLNVSKAIGLFRDVNWVVTSEGEQQDVVREFGMNCVERIHLIQNPVNSAKSIHQPTPPEKVTGELRLVFLSRILRNKNLDLVLHILRDVERTIIFDIYGTIEDEAYWQECESLIAGLPNTVSVNYRGVVPSTEVVSTLSDYQLFVLLTQFENFGHAILEALIAGCPVLISDRTPWNNLRETGAGWVIPLSALEQVRKCIRDVADMDALTFATLRERASDFGKRIGNNDKVVEETKSLFFALMSASGAR